MQEAEKMFCPMRGLAFDGDHVVLLLVTMEGVDAWHEVCVFVCLGLCACGPLSMCLICCFHLALAVALPCFA